MSRPAAIRQTPHHCQAGVSLQGKTVPAVLIPGALAGTALAVTANALYSASIMPLLLGLIGLSAAYAVHRQVLSFTQASGACTQHISC